MNQPGESYRIIDGRPFLPGRRRIAVLSPSFPYPPAEGGAGRMFHLLRQAAFEFDVVLFAFIEPGVQQYEPLLEFCSRAVLVEAAAHPSQIMQELWERLPRDIHVEARQVEGMELAPYGGDILTVPALEDAPGGWRDRWGTRRRGRQVSRMYRRVAVVPNGVDLDSWPPSLEREGHRVLIAGQSGGMEQAWPRVAARFPQATLATVAGRATYEEANVVVGPTLEAMATERAIVATPTAAERLGLEHAVSAWVASDAAGLAEGIGVLLDDPRLRRRLAQAARRVAEARFDWNRIGVLTRGLLREITDRPPAIRQARNEDIPELDRIQRLAPEAVLWEPASYLAYNCRVAEVGSRIAGFVVCRELSSDEAEVLSLVVDPDLRRRGVGSCLIREILGSRPGATWFLEVRESNWRARNLYRKLGFTDISLRQDYYQETGEAAVVMRLKPC